MSTPVLRLVLLLALVAGCARAVARPAEPAPLAPVPTIAAPQVRATPAPVSPPPSAAAPAPTTASAPAPTRAAAPPVRTVAPAPPPAEPLQGFGAETRGGEGGRVVVIDDASEAAVSRAFQDVAKSGRAIVRFAVEAPIRLTKRLPRLTAPFVTIEGNGAVIDGRDMEADQALLDIRTHDVIVRDLRLRNGYDNLRVNGPEAHDVVITHVSSTGARDDGISIAFGARDVTVQYVFVAGNTRGLFLKYGGTTNVSVHHSWFLKNAIRSPLVAEGALADLRNLLVEDWGEWASRFEHGARGNVLASTFVLGPYAKTLGASSYTLKLEQAGPVYTALNVLRGEALPGATGTAPAPLQAPAVRTLAPEEAEPHVRARAGCLPRDRIDRAYVEAKDGWTVRESAPLRLE